jgi:hypothetical protein
LLASIFMKRTTLLLLIILFFSRGSVQSIERPDWTGPDSPEWIYEKGVPKVVTTGGSKRDFYPFYLDPNYISYFHRFIGILAGHIASLTEEERNVFAFIQPAFGSTGDRQLYKGTPQDPKYKISAQQYLEFCSGATKRFYEAFNKPELKHIKFLFNVADESEPGDTKTKGSKSGEQLFANWLRQNYKIELRKQQFTVAIGYQANGEIVQDNELRPPFFGLNGKEPDFVRGEFSKFAQGGIFKENPVWNYYWTAISTVDRGLDLWEVDYETVKTGKYDEGTGQFSFRYDAHSSPDKIAITITKTNSKKWVETTFDIKDGEFANKGPKNSDFSLVNEDKEDDTFHLIEIEKF